MKVFDIATDFTPQRTALFLMGHGTKSEKGRSQFLRLVSMAAQRYDFEVDGGFIELAEPAMYDQLEKFVERVKPDHLVVLPLVLFPAGHQKDDGAALANFARTLPGLTKSDGAKVSYGTYLGLQPQVIDLIDQRIKGVLKIAPSDKGELDHTGVLLVGRGSSDYDANSELYKAARVLAERNHYPYHLIQPAFVSLTGPTVEQGLETLLSLGAKKVVIQPYFLFHGILINRMFNTGDDWISNRANDEIELLLGSEIGDDAEVLNAIDYRLRECLGGTVRTTCDLCIYREHRTTR